jgi:uncharacterized protein YqgC (DUF456 family)
MDWIWYLLLLVVMLFGLFVNILGLPGLWLLVAAYCGYAWWNWSDGYVGWWSIGILIGLGILAEIVEFVAGGAGAKAAGGTKRAMVGGIIGAIVGGIVMSPLFPVIGTIFGACLGAFVGAALIELAIHRDMNRATRVGTGAARGRFWGIIYKTGIGLAMFLVAAIAALPIHSAAAPSSTVTTIPTVPPTTVPATAPATTPSVP